METIVDGVRIGDREREQAAKALGDHYTAGRLDSSEFESRIELVHRAKTQRDLDLVMRDLPGRHRRRSHRPSTGVLVVAAVIVVVAIGFSVERGGPPFFLIPLVWFFGVRPWRRRWSPAR